LFHLSFGFKSIFIVISLLTPLIGFLRVLRLVCTSWFAPRCFADLSRRHIVNHRVQSVQRFYHATLLQSRSCLHTFVCLRALLFQRLFLHRCFTFSGCFFAVSLSFTFSGCFCAVKPSKSEAARLSVRLCWPKFAVPAIDLGHAKTRLNCLLVLFCSNFPTCFVDHVLL